MNPAVLGPMDEIVGWVWLAVYLPWDIARMWFRRTPMPAWFYACQRLAGPLTAVAFTLAALARDGVGKGIQIVLGVWFYWTWWRHKDDNPPPPRKRRTVRVPTLVRRQVAVVPR